jgi:tRNA modification GTPase
MSFNRAILMTPPGVAAIAVVRLTGPDTVEFVQKHFSKPLRPGRLTHGVLRDESGAEIDDPVVMFSPDERFIDVNLHGGAWVVRATFELARVGGFEIVDRPDVPLLAEALDAADTIEREIEAYLALATTELALRVLLAQREAWKSIDRLAASEIQRILADHSLHWLLHPPRVAIIGGANVGKSTLANRLFAQERSITADVPGTTRDWVGEMANLGGLAVQLVDTPGIRETSDAIERQAIHRSELQIHAADLVILVLDATRPLDPEQSSLLARYADAIKVINKIDASHAWEIKTIDAVHTVATSGKGVDELMRRIRAHFGCEQMETKRVRWWTERQRRELASLCHSPGTPGECRGEGIR